VLLDGSLLLFNSSTQNLSILPALFFLLKKLCLLQILRLQECLSKYERSDDGNTPQVIISFDLDAGSKSGSPLQIPFNYFQSYPFCFWGGGVWVLEEGCLCLDLPILSFSVRHAEAKRGSHSR